MPPDDGTRNNEISDWTDAYFNRTKCTVERFGDVPVTYAVFMRRPVVCAPRIAIDWITGVARFRGVTFDIDLRHKEGKWVGAGEPLLYISGSFRNLVDLETLFLQKIGPASVAAVDYKCFGTGSYLPDRWSETYATADIVAYDGVPRVKVGREFLFPKT
jgi:nicotinate phosphoribosyltransferase